MGKKGKVEMNLDGLKSMLKELSTRPVLSVGVFAGKGDDRTTGGENVDNAALAMIHEYGSPVSNIPPRSFIRQPLADHAKEIMAPFAGKCDDFVKANGLAKLLTLVGKKCEFIIDGAFATDGYGKWAPLKGSTIMAKLNQGRKRKLSVKARRNTLGMIYAGQVGAGILKQTQQLRRSIASRVKMYLPKL